LPFLEGRVATSDLHQLDNMVFGLMNSSDRNPGRDTFNRLHKFSVPIIILVAGVTVSWRNDLSVEFLPVACAVSIIYLLMVYSWGLIFRASVKLWKHGRQGS
jgi:hypothetical protein